MNMKLMALGLGILDALAIAMVTANRTGTESSDFSSDLMGVSAITIFFGLICIWFAQFLGSYIGPVSRGGYVDEATPPSLFVAFSWLLLCVPILLFLFIMLVLKTHS